MPLEIHRPAASPESECPIRLPPSEPCEAAIAQARSEIRDLIEAGELDHDELTRPWIEQWAADIYRDDRSA